MTPADQAYVEEFAADSADLMRRALAYAAQRRAEERAKIAAIDVSAPAMKTVFEIMDEERMEPTIKDRRKAADSKEARRRGQQRNARAGLSIIPKVYL